MRPTWGYENIVTQWVSKILLAAITKVWYNNAMNVENLIRRVQARKGTWPQVAADAAVSYSWLVKFAAGEIPDPRFGTLTRLQAALDRPVATSLEGDCPSS